MITPEKWLQLQLRMAKLGIAETDIEEKFIIGSGRGGQNLHKTSSCVYLQHRPTGIEVKCQQQRSREANRFFARRRLCDKYDALLHQRKSEQQALFEKIRRQKRKRSKKAKEKILEQKHLRSSLKKTRKKFLD